ncbi:hypothetical protein MPLDJ20_260031 [Mesorhizobium plurifarium]|uniref:Uncharacterized protein n=1 Tax=Mesorhizobium plurifarium TaxID=69974 RepID=A0A090F6K8_MESPL|nr:hypothetical protein MPLDJ20_260031 [Mesorhizobium plurifarium]
MTAYQVVEPAQLTILAKALDDHCARHRIADEMDREQVALKLFSLFRQGLIDPERLKTELERAC